MQRFNSLKGLKRLKSSILTFNIQYFWSGNLVLLSALSALVVKRFPVNVRLVSPRLVALSL
jgi:hypothetical protein